MVTTQNSIANLLTLPACALSIWHSLFSFTVGSVLLKAKSQGLILEADWIKVMLGNINIFWHTCRLWCDKICSRGRSLELVCLLSVRCVSDTKCAAVLSWRYCTNIEYLSPLAIDSNERKGGKSHLLSQTLPFKCKWWLLVSLNAFLFKVSFLASQRLPSVMSWKAIRWRDWPFF